VQKGGSVRRKRSVPKGQSVHTQGGTFRIQERSVQEVSEKPTGGASHELGERRRVSGGGGGGGAGQGRMYRIFSVVLYVIWKLKRNLLSHDFI
jgi:hypothetical protein